MASSERRSSGGGEAEDAGMRLGVFPVETVRTSTSSASVASSCGLRAYCFWPLLISSELSDLIFFSMARLG